jgi:hypothetical protein
MFQLRISYNDIQEFRRTENRSDQTCFILSFHSSLLWRCVNCYAGSDASEELAAYTVGIAYETEGARSFGMLVQVPVYVYMAFYQSNLARC